MISLLLAFGLFCFFVLVGIATLSLLRYQESVLRTWLLSPAVGLSVVVLIILILNQAGVPVRVFAIWLTVALFLLSIAIILFQRTTVPIQQILPFIGIVLFSVVYTGWPALKFGFDWISYANDDMANYCLGSARFLDNGFYRVPTLDELTGLDYSQYFWFIHVPGLFRCGSELLLAWVVGITKLSPLQIFMPTILALGLVQIWSAAALVFANDACRLHATLSALLLALSPLFSLGIFYQLIAQVGGLGLMMVLCALLMRPVEGIGAKTLARFALLAAIPSAAIAVYYPEITPFGVVAIVLYVVGRWLRGHRISVKYFMALFLISGCVIVLLRGFLISYITTVIGQASGGSRAADITVSLFPTYIVPSGLANLFGLLPIAVYPAEPILSSAILVGIVLFLCSIVVSVKGTVKGEPFAYLLSLMLASSFWLYFGKSDFGLFKLAMFIQPVLMASIAWLVLRFSAKHFRLALFVPILVTLPTQIHYASASLGLRGGSFIEIPRASEKGVARLRIQTETPVIMTFDNMVAARYAALNLRGTRSFIPNRELFFGFSEFGDKIERLPKLLSSILPYADEIRNSQDSLSNLLTQMRRQNTIWGTTYASSTIIDTLRFNSTSLVDLVSGGSILNASRTDTFELQLGAYRVTKAGSIQNWMSFVHSTRGNSYYLGDRRRISMFRMESDYYDDSLRFGGIGRFLLFRVERPSRLFRIKISLTKSLMGPQRTGLPRAARILGKTETELGFIGNGAATVFSIPIEAKKVGNYHLAAIDLGEEGMLFPSHKKGLMLLYGRDVPLDFRRLVAFGRDISALSEEEYENLQRPTKLCQFPADLIALSGLEFSGIYEDGWQSSESFVRFGKSTIGDTLVFKGMVPGIGRLMSGTDLVLRVGDQEAQQFHLRPGAFELRIAVTKPCRITDIRMQFSQTENLASPDDRSVVLKIRELSIKQHGKAELPVRTVQNPD